MHGGEAHPQAVPQTRRAGDLTPGDVILLDGAPYEVVAEPFLGQSGSSIFEAPRLFWRARVRSMRDDVDSVDYATWGIDERVPLCTWCDAPGRRR